MATLDIFNNDAFGLSQLSQTIVDIPRVPTLIGDSGLFTEYGITTTSLMIERTGSALKLLPTAPRGGVPTPTERGPRKMIPLQAVHIPESGAILADEVQNIRAFGSETEVDQISRLVRDQLAIMKGSMDLTLEYHRLGALKGQVLDTDGSLILDIYAAFGFTQETVFFDLGNSNSVVKDKVISLKRKIQAKLGGRPSGKIRVMVSEAFFDALTQHAAVKKAWELWNQGQYARDDQSESGDFDLWGVTFQIYAGGTSAGPFIADTLGYAYPTGVPRLFQTAFAPADFMETVNTVGLPYYARQKPKEWGKGIDFYAQSNPLNFTSLPEAILRVSSAAS